MTMRSFFVTAFLLAAPAAASAQNADSGAMDMGKGATNPATQSYMQSMESMDDKMMAMTPTNDPDKDFVMIMKPHHQAAVDMAEAYLQYGTDPALKKMARDIIRGQQTEIAQMNAWQAAHGMKASQ